MPMEIFASGDCFHLGLRIDNASPLGYRITFGMSTIAISSLHLYPVKSCRGIAVEEAAFDAFGMVDDRRFLIVEAAGSFLTQRSDARLTLIEADFADGSLILRAPNAREMRLPLE